MKIRQLYIKILCRLGGAIDIRTGGKYPANVLSNFTGNCFEIDGVHCKSMEGFLQSLKHQDPKKQQEICQCKGKKAKHKGTNTWKIHQQVYWKGETIDRHSAEYQGLVRKAFQAMFQQNTRFHDALLLTRGKKICHSIGQHNPHETILTDREFCTILTELRDGTTLKHSHQCDCRRTHCPFRKG